MNWRPIFLATLIPTILVSIRAGALTETHQVIRARCSQYNCFFINVLSVKEIGHNRWGTLVEIREQNSSVKAPMKGDEPQYDQVKPPLFEGPVLTGYAFCSLTKPSIVYHDENRGTYYVDVLTPGGDASTVYGANITSLIEYWAICHDRSVTEDELWNGKLKSYARALGYQRLQSQVGQFTFRTWDLLNHFLGF